MGLEGINSNTLRGLDAGRVIHSVPETSTKATVPSEARSTTTSPAPAGVETASRGVPKRLGAEQQLPPNTRLRVDEESNRIVAQILDENNEVVRQIPPEALLDLSTRFSRLEGLLFDRET